MQLGTETELQVFVSSLYWGILLGVVYDLFRILRRLAASRAVTLICDLLYTILFAFGYFVISLMLTDYLRGFVLLGMLLGALMWCMTAGRAAVFVVTAAVSWIWKRMVKKVLGKVYKNISKSMRLTVINAINFKKSKKLPQST